MNTGRLGLSGSGNITAALAFGGETPPAPGTAVTEDWNGASWVEVADLSTARAKPGSSSATTTSSAFAAGGTPDGSAVTAATEEWNSSSILNNVLTD